MKESAYQSKIKQLTKESGAWVFNIAGGPFQQEGIPDLMILHPIWMGFLELKIGRARPRPLQYKVMRGMHPRGIERRFYVVWGQCYDRNLMTLFNPWDENLGTICIDKNILNDLANKCGAFYG